MSEMFRNYDNIYPGYVPNNRHRNYFVDKEDEIVIGGTVHHVFNLCFDYELVDDFEITYKQSLHTILTKNKNSSGVDVPNPENGTFSRGCILVTLVPEETKLFAWNRETFAQIKIFLKDGQVIFSEPSKIKIIDTINELSNRKQAYSAITKIEDQGYDKDYLFEVWYDELDKEFINKHLEEIAPAVNQTVADCSSVRCDNFYGRNYDWNYNNDAVFVVHVSHKLDRFAFDGVSVAVPGLTKEFVESKEYSENYKAVPFYLLDGINEHGVICSMNVVPSLKETLPTGSIPAIETKEKVCAHLFPEYVLEHFATAIQAVDYIRDYVSIYNVKHLADLGYDLHIMIADKFHTYIIEIIDNKNVIIDVTDKVAAMTNFHINGVEFNEDGSLYTSATQDDLHDAIKTNHVDSHGSGTERWNIINENYQNANTEAGMKSLMKQLFYTKAYGEQDESGAWKEEPLPWYSEFAGYYPSILEPGKLIDVTIAYPKEFFDTYIMSTARQKFIERNRNVPDTWQTTHSTIYDMLNRKMYVCTQESGEYYEFKL